MPRISSGTRMLKLISLWSFPSNQNHISPWLRVEVRPTKSQSKKSWIWGAFDLTPIIKSKNAKIVFNIDSSRFSKSVTLHYFLLHFILQGLSIKLFTGVRNFEQLITSFFCAVENWWTWNAIEMTWHDLTAISFHISRFENLGFFVITCCIFPSKCKSVIPYIRRAIWILKSWNFVAI